MENSLDVPECVLEVCPLSSPFLLELKDVE